MCNIKYGMNLRYANIWDTPLRVLALNQMNLHLQFAADATGWPFSFDGGVGLLCALELRQYVILFVHYPLYELVSEGLLRALKILKVH